MSQRVQIKSDSRFYVRGLLQTYLVINPFNIRNIHVVGGGANILILLTSEDINSNQVHLTNFNNIINKHY